MFFFFLVIAIFLGSLFGWLFFSGLFPSFRSKKYCLSWLFITVLSILSYYVVQAIARDELVVTIPVLLRQQLFKFAVFWLVLQLSLVIFSPLWLFFICLRKKLLKHNKVVLCNIIAVMILLVPLGVAVKSVYLQDDWRTINIEIASPNVPQELSGFKIAQVSDTHIFFPEDIDILKEQLVSIEKENPDIIIFTGDLSDARGQISDTVSVFKEFSNKAPLGLWFILGNHEYIQGLDVFLDVYKDFDVSLLKNDGVTLYHNGVPIYLAGVDYPFDHTGKGLSISSLVAKNDLKTALDKRAADQFTILAAHHPVTFTEAFEQNVFLTLSGHTHAYQAGYNRKSLNIFADYTWGLYGENGLFGYVSSGAGEWFPARFGAPREVVIFTLKHLD